MKMEDVTRAIEDDLFVVLKHNGTETDGFQYIDPLSEFWELETGENRIVYSSEDNAEATSIVISYNERFEGV